MARARTATPSEFVPIAAINTTPLIDMMLVILIMLIVSIPMTTHKVPLDLPAPRAVPQTPPVHRLVIMTSGGLAWDGQAPPAAGAAARLEAFQADPARPVLEGRAGRRGALRAGRPGVRPDPPRGRHPARLRRQ